MQYGLGTARCVELGFHAVWTGDCMLCGVRIPCSVDWGLHAVWS